MKKGIIGAGGFGHEVYWSMSAEERETTFFFVDDKYYNGESSMVLPLSKLNTEEYEVVVAIGDPQQRFEMVQKLPNDTKYFTHVNSSVKLLSEDIEIGEGSIICAGTIITTNVKIGKHAHLNLHTTIGHDCIIGDFFTTAPGAKVSGNCEISDKVYLGTNSSVKQKLKIFENVTIGMNGAVVKDINEEGVYGGVPVKKIK